MLLKNYDFSKGLIYAMSYAYKGFRKFTSDQFAIYNKYFNRDGIISSLLFGDACWMSFF